MRRGGLDEYADFELDLRKAAGVSFAHELLSDDSLKAFILSKLGKLADGGKASNDDDGDHPNDGQDGPDGSAPNGKSPPKDDKTGGDGGKATDSAVPPKPSSPVGGEEPMDLGDDVAKAADPIAYEAAKSVEAPADEGELGTVAKSPLPEASTAGLKDTLMEECMPADAAVSKHLHEVKHIAATITHNFSILKSNIIMSSSAKCGNCDCSDQATCVKKGYAADIVETEKSYTTMEETIVMEHDGKCKCGSSCSCTNCTCAH
ncbi:hypothetical protein ACS0TY_016916 [Phlomoides rotata]